MYNNHSSFKSNKYVYYLILNIDRSDYANTTHTTLCLLYLTPSNNH